MFLAVRIVGYKGAAAGFEYTWAGCS